MKYLRTPLFVFVSLFAMGTLMFLSMLCTYWLVQINWVLGFVSAILFFSLGVGSLVLFFELLAACAKKEQDEEGRNK